MSNNDSPIEADPLQPSKALQQLETYSVPESEHILIKPDNQLGEGLGQAAAGGLVAYYLGHFTSYFANAIFIAEIPLYAAFLAVGLLATQSLQKISGKRQLSTLIGGIITGGTTGISMAAIITGMVFGVVGDLITFGSLSLGGMITGYLLTRRGRKFHGNSCETWMPYDTFICPKCKHIVGLTNTYIDRDKWNILELCLYLDTGGALKMNVIKALAFLDFTNLLTRGHKLSGKHPALWNSTDVKKLAMDEAITRKFFNLWEKFLEKYKSLNPNVDPEKTFLYWKDYQQSLKWNFEQTFPKYNIVNTSIPRKLTT